MKSSVSIYIFEGIRLAYRGLLNYGQKHDDVINV